MSTVFHRENNLFSINIHTHPFWRLKFWWRDWYIHRKDGRVKQRLWKLQIERLQFVYWRKR